MTTMEKKVTKLAEIADLGLSTIRAHTRLHAFFSVGFGSSLILSGLLERSATSPAYEYLEHFPGWPFTMGMLFVVAGSIIFASMIPPRYGLRHLRLLCAGLTVEAVVAAIYMTLFTVGTFTSDGTLIGPQWLYAFVAASAASRAYFAWRAIQVVRRTGE